MCIRDSNYSVGLNTSKNDIRTIDASKYEEKCKIHKTCYEYIPDDRPIKLYFDIDMKGNADDYDGELEIADEICVLSKWGISEFIREVGFTTAPIFSVSTSHSERFTSIIDLKTNKTKEL